MTTTKLLAALALTVSLAVPALSTATAADMSVYPRHRHHHRHAHWGLPYHISYLHNYGPGPTPGTFAFYDGPSTNKCYQGSAAYIGQDHRRHPCF
ncbi:hypothetical protein [Bradyrhizobium ivorense]|uniref:hypothetical protein n=1 Tax=Bradyrhizobium ivorense TaxID=2511166 RepID=UPI0010BC0293|nr:hypothetical protein [Bradyrhizobium ivorense]MCC8940719.1 hypothetical protein [Bradyrhizobium ivorense]VIO75958.1 hypothetical protein CI41S_50490 [Bradyrhizobium ivorense]